MSAGTLANPQNVIALISVAGQLVGSLAPLGIDLALKIKHLFEQSKLATVDIKTIGDETIAIDDAIIASTNAWLTSHGFDPIPVN